jgi:hypothetical protein
MELARTLEGSFGFRSKTLINQGALTGWIEEAVLSDSDDANACSAVERIKWLWRCLYPGDR